MSVVCNYGTDAEDPGRHRPRARRPPRTRGGGQAHVEERARPRVRRARARAPVRQRAPSPRRALEAERGCRARGHRHRALRTARSGFVIFVDSSFWIAQAIPRDRLHAAAIRLGDSYAEDALMTSNLVCGETWTYLRRKTGYKFAIEWLDVARSHQ